MRFNRKVIVTVENEGKIIKAFTNAEDANYYFMHSSAMDSAEFADITECFEFSYARKDTLFWCETSIKDITDAMMKNNKLEYLNVRLKEALNQVLEVVMADEKE